MNLHHKIWILGNQRLSLDLLWNSLLVEVWTRALSQVSVNMVCVSEQETGLPASVGADIRSHLIKEHAKVKSPCFICAVVLLLIFNSLISVHLYKYEKITERERCFIKSVQKQIQFYILSRAFRKLRKLRTAYAFNPHQQYFAISCTHLNVSDLR